MKPAGAGDGDGPGGEIPAGESLRKGKAQARCCGHSRGLVLCFLFHPAPNEVCAAPLLPSAWVKLPAIGISTGGGKGELLQRAVCHEVRAKEGRTKTTTHYLGPTSTLI